MNDKKKPTVVEVFKKLKAVLKSGQNGTITMEEMEKRVLDILNDSDSISALYNGDELKATVNGLNKWCMRKYKEIYEKWKNNK